MRPRAQAGRHRERRNARCHTRHGAQRRRGTLRGAALTASAPPSSNEPVQERAPAGSNAHDASREPAPRTAQRASVRGAEQCAGTAEQQASTAEQQASTAEQRSSTAEQWTSDAEQAERLRATLGLAPGAPALDALWALRPAHWSRRIPGRETFAWPDENGPYLVKRMSGAQRSRGWRALLDACARRARGLPASDGSPARAEARALEAWRALGIEAPAPLLWSEAPVANAHEARCALVMERVAHARTLRDELQRASPRERVRWLDLLARRVRALHAAGWCHRDLYLEHWIVPERDPRALVLLDAGRAFAQPRLRARWIVKDLAALAHSRPAVVTRSESWRALLAAAPPAWVRTRAQRRALARRVLRKARRLAAHEPRHWYDRAAQRGSQQAALHGAPRGARA